MRQPERILFGSPYTAHEPALGRGGEGDYWVPLDAHNGADVVGAEPLDMVEIDLKRLWGRSAMTDFAALLLLTDKVPIAQSTESPVYHGPTSGLGLGRRKDAQSKVRAVAKAKRASHSLAKG